MNSENRDIRYKAFLSAVISWAIKVLVFTLVWAGSSFFPPRQGNMDLNDGINLSFYSCVPSRTVYDFFCAACLKNAHSRDFAFFEIFILFCNFFFNVLETFSAILAIFLTTNL